MARFILANRHVKEILEHMPKNVGATALGITQANATDGHRIVEDCTQKPPATE